MQAFFVAPVRLARSSTLQCSLEALQLTIHGLLQVSLVDMQLLPLPSLQLPLPLLKLATFVALKLASLLCHLTLDLQPTLDLVSGSRPALGRSLFIPWPG